MSRNRGTSIRLLATAAAMAGVFLVAACEGSNLFGVSGGTVATAGSDTKAPVVTINVPRGDSLSASPLGDSLFVSAEVSDNVGVSSVSMYGVAKRGDPSLGTDTVVDRFVKKTITLPAGVKDTTLLRYLQPTPDSVRETALIVVEASDAAGNVSADTVMLVLGGPDVKLLDIEDGQSIQAGLNLSARVQAKDPFGINQVRIDVSGTFAASFVKAVSPSADSVILDTIISIPAGATGPISIVATARNNLNVGGQDGPITLNVVSASAGDTIAPRLKLSTTAAPRMEFGDSVLVTVTGSDDTQGTGVAQVGYTVLAISPTRGDTLVRTAKRTLTPPSTGFVTQAFSFEPFNVDSLNLPDTLVFEVTGWMVDGQGNCGAAIRADTLASLPCGTFGSSGETVVSGRVGQTLTEPIVAGRTVLVPGGGRIMDAAVDTGRQKLYLSNISRNRLEVFDLRNEVFDKAIGVGSEPWGLAFSRDADSLWVANSGGTNLSVVDLNAGREDDARRFLTPDVVLFDVELKTGNAGIQYLVTAIPQPTSQSFSDRPQYVAVDSFGNIIYSTRTSDISTLGTARKGYFASGWERSEAKMFVEQGEPDNQESNWAIAHIDSIETKYDTVGVDSLGNPLVEATLGLFDHKPGFPDQVLIGRGSPGSFSGVDDAINELKGLGSDILAYSAAKWNVPNITFQDTTFVAASGDGAWVSIGEGGVSPAGRVLTYEAQPLETTALSRWVQVSDLLTNPSEEVRGLGLNYDGTLGVVRGQYAAYFMSPSDLRLQGLTEIPMATVGAGATLHPLHANARTLENLGGEYRPDTDLAFIASGEHTIDIIDTERFTRIGRAFIRDIITGPLRAVLPYPGNGVIPGDNAGLQCATIPVTDKRGNFIGNAVQIYENGDFNSPIPPNGITDDRCLVMKLFGTSSAGGVVVIDVRKADVLREHPDRN
jgi:hypothetical protein